MMRVAHETGSWIAVHGWLLRCLSSNVCLALGALAYLLFRHILALVWQVVGACVLRCNLLDRVSEFGCIYTKHAFIDLIFEHEAAIFLVDEFLHARRSESLIAEGGVLHAFGCLLELDFLGAIFSFGWDWGRRCRFFLLL